MLGVIASSVFHAVLSFIFVFLVMFFVFCFLMSLYLLPCFQYEIPSKQPEPPDDTIPQKVNHTKDHKRMQSTCSFFVIFVWSFSGSFLVHGRLD